MKTKEQLTITACVDLIKKHEGKVIRNSRHIVYTCPAGKKTIGYGRNLEANGISEHEAEFLLYNDIDECLYVLSRIIKPHWDEMPDSIKLVLVDMIFALGPTGFKRWLRLIAAAKLFNKDLMIKELKDSKWYNGIGKNRIDDLISILKAKEGCSPLQGLCEEEGK